MSTLAEINKNIQAQNKMLDQATESMSGVQAALERLIQQDEKQYNDQIANDAKKESKRAKQEAEDKRERARRADRPQGFTAGLREGINPLSGSGLAGAAGGFAERILGGLFGGASFAAIMGTLGSMVGRGLIFGGAAALIARFGEDILDGLFTDLAPELQGSDKDALVGGLNDAARNGLLVSIASKKAGLGVFLGGAVGAAVNSFLSDEQRQNEIGTVLGQQVTTEDAINTAMQAAGLATMFGGPLAGLTVAIAGFGVIAMDRVRDWIEQRRNEYMDELNTELENRAAEGGLELDETTFLENMANRLGFNIAGTGVKSDQAVVADQLSQLEELLRTQQARTMFTLDDFGGADTTSGSFNSGALNRSMLSEEERENVARTEATLNNFIGDALTKEGNARRAELRMATDQSLANMIRYAEILGRDAEKSFLESILAERASAPASPTISQISPTTSIGEITGEIPAAASTENASGIQLGPTYDTIPMSSLRLEDIYSFRETLPTVSVISPEQMQVLIDAIGTMQTTPSGGGGGQTPSFVGVPLPNDALDRRQW